MAAAATTVTTSTRLSSCHRPLTQLWTIAKIFEQYPNKWISGQEINTKYVLMQLYHQAHQKGIAPTLEALMEHTATISVPGDVQRQLRTFYDKHSKNGLEFKYTGQGHSKVYCFNPDAEVVEVTKPPRMFDDAIKGAVIARTKNKCEVCDNTEERMCGDHWRAYNHYHEEYPNISTEGNCVWLCETCNIIKKDRSAIHLVRKGRCSMERFQTIDDRITGNGFARNTHEQADINSVLQKM